MLIHIQIWLQFCLLFHFLLPYWSATRITRTIFTHHNYCFLCIEGFRSQIRQYAFVTTFFSVDTGCPTISCAIFFSLHLYIWWHLQSVPGHEFPKTFTYFMFWTKVAENISINSKCIKFIIFELFHSFSISYWTVLCSKNDWKLYLFVSSSIQYIF